MLVGAFFMVNSQVATLPFEVFIVITALPGLLAVTFPAEVTVAIALSVLFQLQYVTEFEGLSAATRVSV